MQDLRLIGVHEDGVHLILGDDGGNRYRVPLDEPLRAAVRRDRPRLEQQQIEVDGGLRPKDVQAMIRGGLTAEETAERAGWTVEKVRRYEGPILAEREHVATLGQQVRLRAPGGGPGGGTLGTRVDERLRSRQIDSTAARWDSRRDHRGRWTVVLFFNAGGRQRQAEWSFDLLARTVQAQDDEARWLSADEDIEPAGPIPAPHLREATEVYDVEAEGGLGAPGRRHHDESIDLMAAMRERNARRGRRRRSRASEAPGIDATPHDALPLMPLAVPLDEAGDPPAAHPHPEDDPHATRLEEADLEHRAGEDPAFDGSAVEDPAARGSAGPDAGVPDPLVEGPGAELSSDDGSKGEASPVDASTEEGRAQSPAAQPPADSPAAAAPGGHLLTSQASEASEAPVVADRAARVEGPDEPPAAPSGDPSTDAATARNGRERPARQAVPAAVVPAGTRDRSKDSPVPEPRRPRPAQKRPAARKSGRPSVPSWDDIMFGKKPD